MYGNPKWKTRTDNYVRNLDFLKKSTQHQLLERKITYERKRGTKF